ncbi:MAG: cytidine deaminase [Clostridiales bacterium]|nr:cytidine deaminase [Candidatus Equinaster intestinalis]
MEYKELISAAIKAKENAYAPYSKFKVGAAILTKSGKIFTGVNIENASFSATIFAERTAIFKAVSEGEREFAALALIGGRKNEICYPCGICRQVLSEFCNENMPIIIIKNENEYEELKLADLLPFAFGL